MSDIYPSVTTVIEGLGWNKGPLMVWANKCGLEGKKHWEVAGAAAEAGTLLHALIEDHLKGRGFDWSGYDAELRAKAEPGFERFLSWKESVGLTVRASELKLDSIKHGYRGRLDFVGTVRSELALVDWKNSANVYPEQLIQLAAYGALWTENFPTEPLSGGFHLLRLGDGTLDHHYWRELPDAFSVFQKLLEIYKLRRQLRGLIP